MAVLFKSGRTTVLKLVSAGGTTLNLSSGLSDSSIDRTMNTADVTVYGDGAMAYIAALGDGSGSASGIYASTYERILSGSSWWGASTNPTLRWSPHSTVAGNTLITAPIVITSFNVASPVGDKVSMDLSWQISGAVTSTIHT